MMSTVRHLVIPTVGLLLVFLVVGCARQQRMTYPAGAVLASEGTGRLAYTAPADGEVHIYDSRREELVYTSRVKEGDSIVLDPNADQIVVDGRPVQRHGLRRGTTHQIYFVEEREPRVVREVVTEPRSERREVIREEPERREVIREVEREHEPRRVMEREREIEIERQTVPQ
jgi:hypothetical protein